MAGRDSGHAGAEGGARSPGAPVPVRGAWPGAMCSPGAGVMGFSARCWNLTGGADAVYYWSFDHLDARDSIERARGSGVC